MQLHILQDGRINCVYGELIDLASLGQLSIRRASQVEPDSLGCWHADLSASGGPVLGPFGCRSHAVQAEIAWLEQSWLASH